MNHLDAVTIGDLKLLRVLAQQGGTVDDATLTASQSDGAYRLFKAGLLGRQISDTECLYTASLNDYSPVDYESSRGKDYCWVRLNG